MTFIVSCGFIDSYTEPVNVKPVDPIITDSIPVLEEIPFPKDTVKQVYYIHKDLKIDTNLLLTTLKPIDEEMIVNSGLVSISELDSTIVIDLKYSSRDNFMGVDLYGDFNSAYLQKDVADKLVLAQLFLKSELPSYSIIVYDALRPRSVQYAMWEALKLPINKKIKFLSNPKNGSLHNFGAAVDVSIVDQYGEPIDMGTPYDFIGELAYPRKENAFLASGELTQEIINNRLLLRKTMKKAGFFGISTEWWHFNSCSRNTAYSIYEIME